MSLPAANWDVFLDDACVLCMLFEEGEGDTVHDLSRYRNDGTVYGATWVGTPFGRGLEFDGEDDRVEVPYHDVFASNVVSIEAWVFPAERPLTGDWSKDNYGIFAKRDDYKFLIVWGGELFFGFFDVDGNFRGAATAGKVNKGEWNYVAVSFKRPNLTFCINGVFETFTVDYEMSTTGTAGEYIGRTFNGEHFKGVMGFIRAYDRLLIQEEMRASHHNFRYGIACYKLIGQAVNPLINDVYERVELLRKIQTNRWKIENNQLIIYDDDGETPLLVFDLKDKLGQPTEINVFERVPTS